MAITQLVLLRHAKSDWHSGVSRDFDRPLNHRGRAAAPLIGRWLSEQGVRPQLAYCSPAARTRETLDLILETGVLDRARTILEPSLYHAALPDLLAIVEPALPQHRCVMVIGHNPGLEMLLLHYIADLPIPADGKVMVTCAAAVIEIEAGQPPVLRHLIRPGQL